MKSPLFLIVTTALFVTCVLGIPSPQTSDAKNIMSRTSSGLDYACLAVNPAHGSLYSWSRDTSESAALAAAQNGCPSGSGSCSDTLCVKDGCTALAIGGSGQHALGDDSGNGPNTPANARSNAFNKCNEIVSGDECLTYVVVCSQNAGF